MVWTYRYNFSNNARHAALIEVKGNNSTLQQQHKMVMKLLPPQHGVIHRPFSSPFLFTPRAN
jgi:hypothetical protein